MSMKPASINMSPSRFFFFGREARTVESSTTWANEFAGASTGKGSKSSSGRSRSEKESRLRFGCDMTRPGAPRSAVLGGATAVVAPMLDEPSAATTTIRRSPFREIGRERRFE